MIQHVSNQCALSSVRGQDADSFCWVPEQSHVHEQRDCVLCLAEILDEMGGWLALAFAFVIGYVDELVVICEASICSDEFWGRRYEWQVCERWIAPFVKCCQTRTGASLLIKQYRGDTETDKSQEKRLFEIGVLPEGEILHDRAVLEMVAYEDDTFKGHSAGDWVLKGERNEVLNFSDLGSFFHDHVIVMEAERGDFLAAHGGVCRCHGYDACFFDEEVVCFVAGRA